MIARTAARDALAIGRSSGPSISPDGLSMPRVASWFLSACLVATTVSGCSAASTPASGSAPSGGAGVAVGTTGAAPLTSLQELAKGRIGVLVGSAHEVYVRTTYPNAERLQYESSADITLALKQGKVEAALYDADALYDVMRNDAAIAQLGGPLFTFGVGVGFRSKNDALRTQFNEFLSGIKKDGTYDDMIRRWMTQHDTHMPVIASPSPTGVLRLGTAGGGLPFSAIQDNVPVGIDIELMQRFAAHIGRRLEIVDMQFSALVASVAAGKVDLIANAIFITPEREERIDFSDPYYSMATVAAALKTRMVPVSGAGAAPPVIERSFFQRTADSFQANLIKEHRYVLILDGLKTTVILSLCATIFGTLLGALVCFMRMSARAVLRMPARIFIDIMRGTPVLVILMLVFYVVFASVDISPVFVAILAFGMNFAAHVAELFRTAIESIDGGQTEAGLSLGFSRVQTFMNIILPQTVRRILPVYKGEFISLVKMTSIVGYVAVQDLTKASDIIRSRTFDAFFPLIMVAVLYFMISGLLAQALDYLERRTDPKTRRRAKVRAAARRSARS